MKSNSKTFFLLLFFLAGTVLQAQIVQPFPYRDNSFTGRVNIGNGVLKTTHPSALLELGNENSKAGFLPPRGNKDSISTPALGLLIFDIPSKRFVFWNGTAWEGLGAAGGSLVQSFNGRNGDITPQESDYNIFYYPLNQNPAGYLNKISADNLYVPMVGYNNNNWDQAYQWYLQNSGNSFATQEWVLARNYLDTSAGDARYIRKGMIGNGSIPVGGQKAMVLKKLSDNDYDVGWAYDNVSADSTGSGPEIDPYRVTSVLVTGEATKTIELTLANGAKVSGQWNDLQGAEGTTDGNNYVNGFSVDNNVFTISIVGMAPLTATYTPPAELDASVPQHVKNISQQNITDWMQAFASAHVHNNKAILDAITVEDIERWNEAGAGMDSTFEGNRPITAAISGLQGINPNASTFREFLNAVFYPSQAPTAAMTLTYNGSTSSNLQVEQMASGAAVNVTLNWTAGRAASTQPLQSVVVASVSRTFTQPNPGSTTTGNVSTTVARNTTTTFTNVVTTTDGKSASANASIAFLWRRYYGFLSGNSPSDADIRALTSEYITGRTRGATSPQTPTGAQYFVVAFPESFDAGNASQIWIGGLDQTATFTRTVRSFINASGGTTNYIIYTSNNPTSGSLSFEIK